MGNVDGSLQSFSEDGGGLDGVIGVVWDHNTKASGGANSGADNDDGR